MTLAAPLVRSRAAAAWFAPFAVVVALHLGSKALQLHDLDHATKPLLMPALALPVLVLGRRGRIAPLVALLAGVLLSWLGDVTVENLIVGLSFFLVAHVAYTAMFVLGFRRRISPWAAVYALWWVGFMAVLWGSLGGMLVPVGAYGLALGVMAASATRGSVWTVVGGALFVASDSLLALRLFTPMMQGVAADTAIMALYIAAQTLLVVGMLRRHDGGRR